MRTHTEEFKEQIKELGRQIDGKIYYYPNYNIATEDNKLILSETNVEIVSEQFDEESVVEIDSELIYSMNIVKNGQLLQSLMKELDFEAKEDLKIGSVINPQLGLKVSNYEQTSDLTYQNNKNYYILDNDLYILLIKGTDYSVGDNITGTKYNLNETYEYLDYGNYIIYSKEFNLDTETWSYVCYDFMLYSMIKYKPVNITYPTTIRSYIGAIAEKIGIGFANANDTFVNYDQVISEDVFENKGYTFRDVLDKLSQITASNILINDNDELEVCYVNNTNDIINEEYLKDINVAFGETFGPINRVSIIDNDNKLEYYAEDSQSIIQNEKTQINIIDNELTLNGEEQNICQAILNKLDGLYYSINDFATIGVCYYDYLDIFKVSAKGKDYQCLLLNNEITINQGIKEDIFTNKLENTETSSHNYEEPIMSNKEVQFKINHQEGEIESRVEKNGVISAINQSAEEIKIQANKLSFEGATIDMTADDIKIQGENLEIDSDGTITLTDETANESVTKLASYIVKSTYDSDYQGMTAHIAYEHNVYGNGRKNEYENDNNITFSSGYGHYFGGIEENLYRYPSTRWYFHSNDWEQGYSRGSYVGISVGVQGINTSRLQNGTWTYPISIGIDGAITCVSLTQTSKKESKKNFEKLTNAKEILNATDIYKYNMIDEEDNTKKNIGFVIGDEFNYSEEITSKNNDGANIYSMVSVLWQVVKEQQKEIEELKEMIKNGNN